MLGAADGVHNGYQLWSLAAAGEFPALQAAPVPRVPICLRAPHDGRICGLQVLYTVASLGIADILAKGPQTAQQIASKIGEHNRLPHAQSPTCCL